MGQATAAASDTGRAMSQGNVEIVRRGFEAQNRRDADALLELMHADVEWHPAMSAKLGGGETVLRGRAAVRAWMEEVWQTFDESELEMPDVRDEGGRVVAIGRIRTRGRASGVETESAFAYVIDIEHGLITRLRTYLDPRDIPRG